MSSEAAIQASANVPPPPIDHKPTPPPEVRVRKRGVLVRALSVLASLRLTVALLFLAVCIVFFGTLAQVDMGNWTVVDKYFRFNIIVWIPFKLFFPSPLRDSIVGGFPFPTGWTIGTFLLVNLLAAHIVRFKVSWKRSGILLIHAGLIVIMVSELTTGLFAVEATMSLAQGETVDFVDVSRKYELALIDGSDPKSDTVVAIPASRLERGGRISDALLPFDVEVQQYMKNSTLVEVRGGKQAEAMRGSDGHLYAVEPRAEGNGVEKDQPEDRPSARLVFKQKDTGAVIDQKVVSVFYYRNALQRLVEFPAQTLKVDGKTYTIEFRNERVYKPYKIHLQQFTHETYINTDKPKNFASQVRVTDPIRDENRETLISMNNPLRYDGETFYQAGVLPHDSGTILQVVRNPSWLMPYISCVMVGVGLFIHFGLHLVGFVRQRGA